MRELSVSQMGLIMSRYFYRVSKLKQAEDMRVELVKRAISREEEDFSWDVDDDMRRRKRWMRVMCGRRQV